MTMVEVVKFYPKDAAKNPDNVLEQAVGMDSHDLAMCEDTEIKSAARAAYLGEKHDR